jgi:hypothetical protein
VHEDIFIAGKLTDWSYGTKNKMEFIPVSGLYKGNLFLKQGLYDFIYYMPDHPETPFLLEGNHFETRNQYEIIVYYKDPAMSTDLIIGYTQFE